MGKNASKHVHRPCECPANEECFLVNAHLNKAWEEQIWKKTTKTGYNLANYNMNQSMSELSICLEDKQDNTDKVDNTKDNNVPLKVELPPIKSDIGTGKVFTVDQADDADTKDDKLLKSRLNIEEFECGVHFGGGENSKQEWSFTLYDFDGHGKITKEDLVGLLKALYDAIGSSIKIPNNGTKTLKLRLSVGQETAINADTTATQAIAATMDKPSNVKEDNDTKAEAKTTPKKKDNSKGKEKDNSKVKDKDNSKSKDKHKDTCKVKVKDISRLNNLVSPVTKATGTGMPKCTNETQAAQSQAVAKARLGTHKHKELVNLVQENMERNHIKPLRRHHSDCRGCHSEHPHHKRRTRPSKTTNSAKDNNMKQQTQKPSSASADSKQKSADADDTPKECQDRRNYYLDLAGVENTSSKFQDLTTTTALDSGNKTELNNSQANTSTGVQPQPVKSHTALPVAAHFCVPRHFRSRSHEITDKSAIVTRATGTTKDQEQCIQHSAENPTITASVKQDHLRSRSFDPQDSSVSNIRAMKGNPHLLTGSPTTKPQSRFRPVSLPTQIPETVSPHYHRRHRHREKNHDMAMQQVAEWIEREHAIDLDGDKIIIQRHEHHHVHEHHHHHHYHHYYEA